MLPCRPVSTDEELLEAWRSGDNQAGTELFERHFDSLYAFLRNKIDVGVDDLVQKTFLACVEGRDRFRGDSSFRAYMLGAARRILYGEYERRHREADRIDFGSASAQDLAPSPSSVIARRAEQRLLLEALRRIPLDYQTALELYYVQGFRGPQLAEILDVPEATVRSRIRRGLEQLRARVEQLRATPELSGASIANLETWMAGLGEVVSPAPSGA